MSPTTPKVPQRRLGDYYRSGDWSDYWRTSISYVGRNIIRVRGYNADDVIENLTYPELFFLTIKGELPTKAQARVFDAVLCSFPDHQFISSDTTAARFVASAHSESPIPGIAAGLLCVGMHTISPHDAAEEIDAAYELMKSKKMSMADTAKMIVERHVKEKSYIPGFGHPTHKEFDPRAAALAKVAKANGVWGEKSQLYEAIHTEFVKQTKRDIVINVDGMVACILTELKFDPNEMAGVAAAGRLPAVVAHVVEELNDGVPLRVVPEELGSKYIGPPERRIDKSRK